MYANYHTHTYRCQHGKGTDREYVEQAIASGLKVLGFSDHCPWVYDNDYVSPIRMKTLDVDGYFSSLLSLKKEYEKDITIYIGFESEYIPELMEKQDKLLSGYPVDYMILGQHYNEAESHSHYNGHGTNSLNHFTRYIDLLIEGMESGRYKYVAHPDILYYAGEESIRVEQYTRLCKYFKEHDLPIEINLIGVKKGFHYPSDRLLRIAHKIGNTAIIGIDAHTPELISDKSTIELCEAIVANYNNEPNEYTPIKLIDYLPGLEPKI